MRAEWDDLARLAEAATPGPWEARQRESLDWLSQELGDDTHQPGSSVHNGDPGNPMLGTVWPHRNGQANAEFIAAANPATILHLIETLRLRDLRLSLVESERDDLRSEVEQVRSYADMWRSTAVENETERDRLAARLAAVEALADEWERTEAYRCTNAGECPRCLAYQSAVIRVRAALAAPTDTTKEN